MYVRYIPSTHTPVVKSTTPTKTASKTAQKFAEVAQLLNQTPTKPATPSQKPVAST